ncbi:MAG: hypothetical protein NC402_03055 [Prevotella sp.]|nr:hypothetical protein [Prevotella sp.]MCM1075115.1 hypothetical protein [Ruminococcus sp.]
MTTAHKIAFTVLTLLWLGLSFLVLDLSGVTLLNIIWVLLAGAFILLPLWKKWNNSDK